MNHIAKSKKCSHHLKIDTIEAIRTMTKRLSAEKRKVYNSQYYKETKDSHQKANAKNYQKNKRAIKIKSAIQHKNNRTERLKKMSCYNKSLKEKKKDRARILTIVSEKIEEANGKK